MIRAKHDQCGAPDRARAAAVFLAVFALCFSTYSRLLPAAADEMLYYALTQSLAKWQVFTLDQVSTVGPGPEEFGIGGHRYSKKGPLTSLLAVPLFWLAQRLPIGAVDTVLLLNHIVTALTATLLFLLARRLGYSPAVALAVAGIATFCTPLWVYAKSLFSESTITLCLVMTLYAAHAAATTQRRAWIVATGLGFGLAAAAKNLNAALLAPVPLYIGWSAVLHRRLSHSATSPPNATLTGEGRGARRDTGVPRGARDGRCRTSWWRVRAALVAAFPALAWFGLGLAPMTALLMVYSQLRYGTPLSGGYGDWETFSTPIWAGVAGIPFSPGKSIVVYTPLFLMLVLWAPLFARRFPWFSALLGAIVVLHLAFYGTWYVWWGAWGWGSRFTVSILPVLSLLLAEGLARPHRSAVKGIVLALAGLSIAVQVLGVSVHSGVYLGQLLPFDPRPDTLTLYDPARSPILNQIPLMTREHLDFAWIERAGPSAVNTRALTLTLTGAFSALAALLFTFTRQQRRWWLPALAVSALLVMGSVYLSLRTYYRGDDPAIAAISDALAGAPAESAVVQMIPSAVVPYYNRQKRSLPELGWIEAPDVTPIVSRLDALARRHPEIWVVTEAPAKAPTNAVESLLNRSLVQIADEPFARFRLLRYATQPSNLPFVSASYRFGAGIALTGFVARGGPVEPGRTLDLTLRWQAGPEPVARPDYVVFTHLVGADATLLAQHDGPPAGGYAPTSQWEPRQVIHDHHRIAVPAGAARGPYAVRVGLYLLATGERVSVVDAEGRSVSDFAVLDVGGSSGE
ncbi:MAG: glycosyltransferase family 39 protein [Chloroflexi bacterium]|nr:glycosyltransferase family 39 protein [Chloroflexota bacterium]